MSELGIINNIDINSEQNLIAGLIKHQFKAWAEISDIVQTTTLIADSHQNIYKVMDYVFKKHGDVVLDWPTLINGANAVGLQGFFDKKEEKQYYKELREKHHIELSNVKILGLKLRKLQVTRQLREEILKAEADLLLVNGDERLSEILAKVETPVANFSQYLRGIDKNGPELIFQNIDNYLDGLETNPVQQIGISTGYKKLDALLGGGLINGSVTMIAARYKQGKSTKADNIALNICKQSIPICMLDTEMNKEQHYQRMLACLSGVAIDLIKTGQYSKCNVSKEKVRAAAKLLKSTPYHYLGISGQNFDETLSEMRRWVMNVVGLNNKGYANPCVIILDYLKIMNESLVKNIAEWQKIGYMATDYVNFAIKYQIPCMSFLQLNQEQNYSTSDRIQWFFSSGSKWFPQSEDEIQHQRELGIKNPYNFKLVCEFAREGPANEPGDYINMRFDKRIARITEGPLQSELEISARSRGNQGNIVGKDDEEIQF